MIRAILLAALVCIVGCSSQEMRHHEGYATQFKRGQFVKDVRPLVPPDSPDLRELALTLPVLENGPTPGTLRWIYARSKPAVEKKSWNLPGDGAQAHVLVKRLPSSAKGAQRIAVTIRPIPLGNPLKAFRYNATLERSDGGWLVLSARRTQYLGQ